MHKRNLAAVVLLLAVLVWPTAARAVVRGQVDTFGDATTAGFGGGSLVVASGGPGGVTDKFLEVSSNGQDGPGSKLITYNRSQWLGNYNAAGVTQIAVDLENLGSTELFVRIAFKDGVGTGAAGYACSSPFVLPANPGWLHTTFNLESADFTAINNPSESLVTLLSGPAEFRILSSSSPALDGDVTVAMLGIDNVTAGPAAVPEPVLSSMLVAGVAMISGRSRRAGRRERGGRSAR